MKEIIRTMCSYSETMPEVPFKIILREQYLNLFDQQFDEHKILAVKGQDGVGVSTVMALYAQRHANSCASYFNTTWSQSMLDIRVVERSLVNQLCYYIGEDKDVEMLHTLIHKVNNVARKKKENVYFVLDRFDLLPLAYTDAIKQLLSQLYGINNARFLFSGDINRIKQLVPDPEEVFSTNDILPFSKSDVYLYLQSLNQEITPEQADVLYEMSKGIGERLHIIVDKMRKEGVDALLDMYYNNISDLYALDYEEVQKVEHGISFMSLLTFSEYPLSKAIIMTCMEISPEKLDDILNQFEPYITNENGVVSLRSNVFRKYLQTKLRAQKAKVDLMLISILEKETVEEAFDYLPALYIQHRKRETLVAYLTSDKVQHYLEDQQSQAALNKQCDYGYKACTNFDAQMPAYFRFAVNRSASREIEKNKLTDSEIDALMSVGDYERAFVLAQNVFLHEERLKCFLLIAQYQNKLPVQTRQELLSQIASLTRIIQFEQIPDKAIELAKLMLPVNFVEALTIIDRVAKVTKDKQQLNRLYAAISVSYNHEGKQSSDAPTKEDLVETKIEDDELRQMATVMKTILQDSSVEHVIQQMDKLPTATSKLYFLHFWIPNHKKSEHIEDAIRYALKLTIDESNTTIPKVSFIRRFCEPLPLVAPEYVEELVQMIDSVVTSIKYPTVEYVELQLLVIAALKNVDIVKAEERVIELYYEIDDLSDKSIRAHCKAFLLRDFDKLGAREMEKWIGKASFELQEELTNDIADLLSKSAYHIKVVEGPIKALVCTYSTFVCEIIEKMNTEERRCRAYLMALLEYVSHVEMSKFEWRTFEKFFSKIMHDVSDIERPLMILANRIVEDKDITKAQTNIRALCSKLGNVEHASVKCKIYALFFVWLSKNNPDNGAIGDIKKQLQEIWSGINSPRIKVELGFRIAQVLAKESTQELAKEYVAESIKLQDSTLFSSLSCAEAYAQSLTLLEHSLGILIRANISEQEDLDELETLFEYEGDEGEAMIAWAKIALEFLEAGRRDKFTEILRRKFATTYSESSVFSSKRVLYNISPALYLQGPSMFYERISKYDESFQNLCIENVARYVVNHYPYPEYIDTDSIESQRVLEYKDYEYLIDLMEHTSDECFIFNYIETITTALKGNYDNQLSREHIVTLCSKLEKLVQDRFPMANGIQHDGYKIICNAMISGSHPNKAIDPVRVRTEIESIPNVADRSFLYSNIASYLKKKDQSKSYIDSALQASAEIGDMFDQLNRMNNCYIQAYQSNKTMMRPIAQGIMSVLMANKNGTYMDFQRYIDTISEYDEKIAEDVLEMVDNDPARVQYKKRLKARLDSTKRLKGAKNDFDQIAKLSDDEIIRFFDKQMEALVKKANLSKEISKTKNVVQAIYNNPISEVQNAILFFMENLYLQFKRTRVSAETLREIHRVLQQNVKIVLALAAGTQTKLERINQILSEKKQANNIIGIGEGAVGREKIISWYNNHPYGELQIIDAYFVPEELGVIKALMDINNELHVTILTCLNTQNSLDDYQREWRRISNELPGNIKISNVYFTDSSPIKSPIHDRWWILYDQEEDHYEGIRMASVSTFGSRETEISIMDQKAIDDVCDLWAKYAIRRPMRVDGKAISYDNIEISV